MSIDELARQLGEDPRLGPGVRLRQGQIAVFFFPDSVSITLAGSATVVPSVRFLESYTPVVGDIVWVLQNGPDLVVIGKVRGAAEWVTWTPGVSGAGTITPNAASTYYRVRDGVCEAWFHIQTGTFTANPINFSLPVPMASAADLYLGNGMVQLSSGGGIWNQSAMYANGASTFIMFPDANSIALGTAYGAVTSVIYGRLHYRVA